MLKKSYRVLATFALYSYGKKNLFIFILLNFYLGLVAIRKLKKINALFIFVFNKFINLSSNKLL